MNKVGKGRNEQKFRGLRNRTPTEFQSLSLPPFPMYAFEGTKLVPKSGNDALTSITG